VTISMYKASVPVFIQHLTGLAGVLEKTKAHIEARKLDERFFLTMRLQADMFPLIRQVRAACDHAVNCSSRLAGVDVPEFDNKDASIDDLKARIEKTIAFLRTIKPEAVDGSEDREIVIKLPNAERTFTGLSLLLGFSLPNFFFHDATAYNILRHCGVALGKRDFMGAPAKA